MTLFTWIVGIISIVTIGFVIWIIFLPNQSTAVREIVIDAPMPDIFSLVTDIEGQQNWRSDIGRVELSSDGLSWTEFTKQNLVITFKQEAKKEGLYKISFESDSGFSGVWEGRFQSTGQGTAVQITETITTHNIMAKVMGRIFAPVGDHIDLYLTDLKRALD